MNEPISSDPAELQEAVTYHDAEEEIQLWAGAYSVRMFIPAVAVGLPLTGVLFALARYWDPDNQNDYLRYGVEGVLLLTWLGLLGLACYRVLGTEYMLTNKNLYCRRGFGHPGLAGVNLAEFLDVRVKQSGLEKLLRAGRIILTRGGIDGSAHVLAGVPDPERVAGLFRRQLREVHLPKS
jgi:hypothetical protein